MAETITLGDTAFAREVERKSRTPVSRCFQCHKCSTGCPVAPEMDVVSSQMMRLINLGEEATVLSASSIWFCASCEACTTRCPMDIDIAAVMDTLRIMAVARGLADKAARAKHFNNAFLASVRRHGRVFELGMMTSYKLRSLDLFGDTAKVPRMFMKRKLGLLPRSPRGAGKEIRQIFERAAEEEETR